MEQNSWMGESRRIRHVVRVAGVAVTQNGPSPVSDDSERGLMACRLSLVRAGITVQPLDGRRQASQRRLDGLKILVEIVQFLSPAEPPPHELHAREDNRQGRPEVMQMLRPGGIGWGGTTRGLRLIVHDGLTVQT